MPGTIQVSILELAGLPSVHQSSSIGIMVSMGKQAYDIQDKGDFSFILASLRDDLNVTVHDSEGNEIARTGVESRSIVEKGIWDDIFPLQGGGHVRMRLHFILTEEEQKRIRSMRESAARKKQEDLLKRSHSSSDLSGASGGSSATRGDSLKMSNQAREGIVNPGPSSEVPSQVFPRQKKQAFSTSKSSGALDKLPSFERVKNEFQDRKDEQQSQLDKTSRNIRNMILAFESSSVKEAPPATNKTRATNIPLKTVPLRPKPVLSRLETVAISEEKVEVREEVKADGPVKSSKKMVSVSARPVLPDSGRVLAPTSTEIVPLRPKRVLSRLEAVPVSEEKVEAREEIKADVPVQSPKKMVSVSAKPVLPDLEIVLAPTSTEIVMEKEEIGKCADSYQETLCSTTTTGVPLKLPKETFLVRPEGPEPVLSKLEIVPIPISEEKVAESEEFMTDNLLKLPKMVSGNAKPVLSNLEIVLSPNSKYIVSERQKIGDCVNSSQETSCSTITTDIPLEAPKKMISVTSKPVLSNLETSTAPISEEKTEEEIISPNKLHSGLSAFEASRFSWNMLYRELPHKIADNSFTKKRNSTSSDSCAFKKIQRSKYPKSREPSVRPGVSCARKYYSSGSFRGWIFLEDMVQSCERITDGPRIDVESGYSSCSQDTIQEKVKDIDIVSSKDEKNSVELSEFGFGERPDRRPHLRPVRQVVNIAIMVGFGILVLLRRQRK